MRKSGPPKRQRIFPKPECTLRITLSRYCGRSRDVVYPRAQDGIEGGPFGAGPKKVLHFILIKKSFY